MMEQQNKAAESNTSEAKAIGSGVVESKAIGSGTGKADKKDYFEKAYGWTLTSLAGMGLLYIVGFALVLLISTLNVVSAWMGLILFMAFGSGIFVAFWSVYYLRYGIKLIKQEFVPKRITKRRNIMIIIMAVLQIWMGIVLMIYPDDTLFISFGLNVPMGAIFVIYGVVIIPMAIAALKRTKGMLEW